MCDIVLQQERDGHNLPYTVAIAAVSLAAYIVGSLNSAIISVFLIKREDIREHGSKNAGLTNVYRCFGAGCAAVTLIMDLAKGFVVVFGAKFFLFGSGLFSADEFDVTTACLIASVFAILGHVFPVFYKFKGGKGILVGATCSLAINPIIFVLGLMTMVLAVAITRYISIGSIACCLGFPLFILAAEYFSGGISGNILIHMLLAGFMGILCIVRHASNIKRLIDHTENKFTFKRDKEEHS